MSNYTPKDVFRDAFKRHEDSFPFEESEFSNSDFWDKKIFWQLDEYLPEDTVDNFHPFDQKEDFTVRTKDHIYVLGYTDSWHLEQGCGSDIEVRRYKR